MENTLIITKDIPEENKQFHIRNNNFKKSKYNRIKNIKYFLKNYSVPFLFFFFVFMLLGVSTIIDKRTRNYYSLNKNSPSFLLRNTKSNEIYETSRKLYENKINDILSENSFDKIESKSEIVNESKTNEEVGKVFFLPTQGPTTQKSQRLETNLSVLIRASDGTTALIDTGDSSACCIVESYLYKYAKHVGDFCIIKYLILTHFDGDHIGCFENIIKNGDFIVENLIMKKNKINEVDKKITQFAKTYYKNYKDININIIYTNDEAEGFSLPLDSGVSLKFYNIKDIYENHENSANDCNQSFEIIKFYTTKDGATKKASEKLVVLKSLNSTLWEPANEGDEGEYYLHATQRIGLCKNNGNSIAVLVAFKTQNSREVYAYIPGDLDNNGFPLLGENYDGVNITGDGTSFAYKIGSATNGNLIGHEGKSIKIPAQYNTAKNIANDISYNSIIIYSAAHHGYSDDPASINKLNLNRYGVNVVYSTYFHPGSIGDFLQNRSYGMTLKNAQGKIFYTGNGEVIFTVTKDGNVTPNRKKDG